MSSSPEATGKTICLAYAGSYDDHLEVIPLLDRVEARATFFIAPELAIDRANEWIAVQEKGHELGNGTLCHVTDDGRILNWRRLALIDDLIETNRLLKSWGNDSISAAYLPGSCFEDSEGDYFEDVAKIFTVVIGQRSSLNRQDGRLAMVELSNQTSSEVSTILAQGKIPIVLIDGSLRADREQHDSQLIKIAAQASFATLQEIRFL